MTSNEVLGLIGGFIMASMIFYYLYIVNKHQRELMKELKELNK